MGVPPRCAFALAPLSQRLAHGRACPGLARRSVHRAALRYASYQLALSLHGHASYIQHPRTGGKARHPSHPSRSSPLPTKTQVISHAIASPFSKKRRTTFSKSGASGFDSDKLKQIKPGSHQSTFLPRLSLLKISIGFVRESGLEQSA